MALYTETLREYLNNGNILPVELEQIEGFKDLFIAHYGDSEIGFETEELFKIKLQLKANIFIPLYKQRIAALTKALTNAENPVKTYYDQSTAIATNGEQHGSVTDLPFNSLNAEPSQITKADAYENNTSGENTRTETGVTPMEAYEIIDKLNRRVHSITIDLLDEFKGCFMGVY